MAGNNPWLLLLYDLPTRPSRTRVRTWRRLQKLGAVPVRNSVYILPNAPQCREDFEWLREEIAGQQGHADIFAVQAADARADQQITAAFQQARQRDYGALQRAAEKLLRRAQRLRGRPDRRSLARSLRQLHERLDQTNAIDFFRAPGREQATAALARISDLLKKGETPMAPKPAKPPLRREDYQARTWVTRPGPKVDRMASAWLIRRFIDPQAGFAFAAQREELPAALPFDMYGAEFGHQGDGCSFETLVERFQITDLAVQRIAQIVHDSDLKDEKFRSPEAPAVGRMVDGLCDMYADDQDRLERGMALFEALYRSFAANPTSGAVTPRRASGRRRRVARKRAR